MAKRRCLALLPLAAGLGAAFPAQAAWDFTPVAGARATYSDNVGLQPDERAEGGFVYEFTPGFELSNHTARFQFDLNYGLHLYRHSGATPNSAQRHSQDLSAALRARLVEEVLFMDAKADVHQQAVSAFAPLSTSSNYLKVNQNEVRTYSVSPYLLHRFGAFANGTLRYAHDRVSSDHVGFAQSNGNTISAQLASGPSFRRFSWDASAARGVVDEKFNNTTNSAPQQTTSSKNANLGLYYAYSQQLNLGVFGGYDEYDYASLGGAQSGAAYGLNLSWEPSSRTALKASAGHRFYGPSYSLSLQHRSRGTVWNIAYSDSVSSTRSQFVLPQAVDTASMLDSLFRAQISDPVLRAAAVRAYMQSAGLPPALANNVNFFSNRYSLQKQLNASMAWGMARTTSLFSVFKLRRRMLSSQAVDSGILGSSLFTFNDNTDQVGATASMHYKLGAQTTAGLMATALNAESLTDGRRNQHRDVRLNLTRNFGARANGILEVRRVRGSVGVGSQQYTENAVSASLTSKF